MEIDKKPTFFNYMLKKVSYGMLEWVGAMILILIMFSVLCLPLACVGYWTLELCFGIGYIDESLVKTYYANGFIGMVLLMPIGLGFACVDEIKTHKRKYNNLYQNNKE